MNKWFVLLCACLITTNSSAQKKNILFIGNSYTAANNLPQLLLDLSLSLGDSIFIDSYTPGGYTFQMHSTDVNALAKINSRPWDFVILQEQSQRPSLSPPQVAIDVYPYARVLDSLIYLNNPCTETVFYMTWGRKYGDASNCASWPPVCTYLGMQDQLRNSYVQMANDNQAIVAPVGRAWQQSWSQDSLINLWSNDNSHPSLSGSYLAACVFYESIFRKLSVNAPFISSLSMNDAQFLQQVAHQTIIDSLSTWRIGADDSQAGFAFAPSGLSVQFTEQCQNANSFFWDFGDGNTSLSPQPLHVYTQAGVYQVRLIAGNNCDADTSIQFVNVMTSGIEDVNASDPCIKISAQKSIEILCENWSKIEIYEVSGKRILSATSKSPGNSIAIDYFKEGIYILVFYSYTGNIVRLKYSNY